MTNQCCGLAVIFCGFISHLIRRQTINIPEIFSGVHGFTGRTVRYYDLMIQIKSLFLVNTCNWSLRRTRGASDMLDERKGILFC